MSICLSAHRLGSFCLSAQRLFQNFPLQNVGCSRGFRVQEEEAEMEGEGFTFARRITEMYIFLAGGWAHI